MSDSFECPKCKKDYDISELELWAVYESEGKETEFDCTKCGAELIITSEVVSWNFDVMVND